MMLTLGPKDCDGWSFKKKNWGWFYGNLRPRATFRMKSKNVGPTLWVDSNNLWLQPGRGIGYSCSDTEVATLSDLWCCWVKLVHCKVNSSCPSYQMEEKYDRLQCARSNIMFLQIVVWGHMGVTKQMAHTLFIGQQLQRTENNIT